MEHVEHSPRFLRQRRFLLVLPLLVLPFLTLFFWAMGGGKTSYMAAQAPSGLRVDLPDAHLEEEMTPDKLAYYKQALSDSSRLRAMRRKGAFGQGDAGYGGTWEASGLPASESGSTLSPFPGGRAGVQDSSEARVYRKLDQLQAVLAEDSPLDGVPGAGPAPAPISGRAAVSGKDLDRLEQMMQAMQQGNSGDREVQQLNGMLEKILDIQHPGRVAEKIRQAAENRKGQVFAVAAGRPALPVSLLGNGRQDSGALATAAGIAPVQNSFYSSADAPADTPWQNTMEAVVPETQTLVSGATVRLRLTGQVAVNGTLLPRGTYLYGTATLAGERLKVAINAIRYQHSLFPVALSVFDLDGQEGIYIPGTMTQEVVGQSADRAVQDIGFSSLPASLPVQAASVGVETAKSLLRKKTRRIKVTVKAGYQVLLQDTKQQGH